MKSVKRKVFNEVDTQVWDKIFAQSEVQPVGRAYNSLNTIANQIIATNIRQAIIMVLEKI